jgi:hypothetical protein
MWIFLSLPRPLQSVPNMVLCPNLPSSCHHPLCLSSSPIFSISLPALYAKLQSRWRCYWDKRL